jgi:tetratricopeptide (TPR) repeat protein
VGALLSPIVVFGILELLLRIVGFGGSYPLFLDYPDVPGARSANPEVMNRYVPTGGEPVARIDPFLFAAVKPDDGYRIVVQGGSTAAGFPYGRWGGLAGMLHDRFEAAMPERAVEVISTAMAAVNSHTLADLVDEIIEIEPDAVLIYAGHNEYLGVLGVGSALTANTSDLAAQLQLRLRGVRIYELLQRIVAASKSVLASAASSDRNTLFALAASGAQIPLGSELYRAGIDQFEANLAELLGKYQSAGIPVYLGTLVSNERDLPPFVGGPGDDVDPLAWARLDQIQRARRVEGKLDAARAAIEQMLELDRQAADAWYALGKLELAEGRMDAAAEAFRAARDRDPLRFRAPSELEASIRALAKQYGASVVEVRERFERASTDGVVGDTLMLEHVHPNAEGYFLLADAFYEALLRSGDLAEPKGAPSREAARRDMPLTELDRILADYHVREMKAGFPFSDPPRTARLPAPGSEVERIALARHRDELERIEAMTALSDLYQRQGRMADAARVARLAAQEYPADHGPNFVAATLLARLNQLGRARLYLERSLRAQPDHELTLVALVEVELALGDEARSREYLEQLRVVAPAHPLLDQPRSGN